jgi:predicted ATPase/DNA-binding XRE family transcriptional regulator
MRESFGALLRRLRLEAELSQEHLAEKARISVSAISAYERGIHAAPHRDTVALLGDSLALTGTVREEFELAARRGPRRTSNVRGDGRVDNLPLQTTTLLGRDFDILQIEDLVRKHRLVTVSGTAGIGKTRAATHAAQRLSETFRDGVAFVGFGSTLEEALVISEVARTLQIPLPAGPNPTEEVAARLRDRSMLLIFDNCEHLIAPIGSLVSTIIQNTTRVSILATSRERLRLGAEAVYRLSPLPVPPEGTSSANEAVRYAAIALLADRAAGIDAHFKIIDADVPAVVEIARALDGIPLALELAAARISTLGVVGLRDQLQLRLSILSAGNRDGPARQRTLDAALSWSVDTLSQAERTVFRRLSVFAGGWTLDAAQDVCADAALDADAVCDALSSLVDKSLVIVDVGESPVRYNFLYVVRRFAFELNAGAGDADAIARSHADWLVRLGEPALLQDGDVRPGKKFVDLWTEWHERYDVELGNVRAAIDWALHDRRDPPVAGRIMIAYYRLWNESGLIVEYESLSAAALAHLDVLKYPYIVAQLLKQKADWGFGPDRIAAGERAVALFEQIGDEPQLAHSLGAYAWALQSSGQLQPALEAIERAERLYEKSGTTVSIGFATLLRMRSTMLAQQGRMSEARLRLSEAIEIGLAFGEVRFVTGCRINCAENDFVSGDIEAAIQGANEAIQSVRDLGMRGFEMLLLANRANYHHALGKVHEARTDALAALSMARDKHPRIVNLVIGLLASVALSSGKPEDAARLIGFVVDNNARDGVAFEPAEQLVYEKLMSDLGAQMPGETIARLTQEGAALTTDDAILLSSRA